MFLPPIFSLRLCPGLFRSFPSQSGDPRLKVPGPLWSHYLELISTRSSFKFYTPNFLKILHSLKNMFPKTLWCLRTSTFMPMVPKEQSAQQNCSVSIPHKGKSSNTHTLHPSSLHCFPSYLLSLPSSLPPTHIFIWKSLLVEALPNHIMSIFNGHTSLQLLRVSKLCNIKGH